MPSPADLASLRVGTFGFASNYKFIVASKRTYIVPFRCKSFVLNKYKYLMIYG